MDGGAWKAEVHGVAEGQTWLSDFTFTFHFHALEKEMATHSSVLAWRIPGTGEPGGLPSMGSHRVGHDWNDLAARAAGCFLWWVLRINPCFYAQVFGNLCKSGLKRKYIQSEIKVENVEKDYKQLFKNSLKCGTYEI